MPGPCDSGDSRVASGNPGPFLTLARHYTYPELDLAVDQYAILEADGTVSVDRNWFRYFDAKTITDELKTGGFVVEDLYGDLTGADFDPDGPWIGVVARKV